MKHRMSPVLRGCRSRDPTTLWTAGVGSTDVAEDPAAGEVVTIVVAVTVGEAAARELETPLRRNTQSTVAPHGASAGPAAAVTGHATSGGVARDRSQSMPKTRRTKTLVKKICICRETGVPAEAATVEDFAVVEEVLTEVVSAAATAAAAEGAEEVVSEVDMGVTGVHPAGGADALEQTSHPRENTKLR